METLFVGRNVIFLPEVDSTNSYAIELLKNVNTAEGTVVYTANQTRGKGQRGNVWNSEPASNLTVSFILKPVFLELKNQFLLYQVAALACYDVLAELLNSSQFDIKIKWPNDLLVNEKKIAGILIENAVMNNRLNYSVLGIGMNINQREFDPNIHAVSLQLLLPGDYTLNQMLSVLSLHLEKYYLLLKNNKTETITQRYLAHFYKLHQWQDFEISTQVKKLKVEGVSPNGLLLLTNEQGEQFEYDVKEVKWKM